MAKRLKGKAETDLLRNVKEKVSKRKSDKFRRGFKPGPPTKGKILRKVIRGGKKASAKRATGTRKLLTALGAHPGKASGAGAGRPKGSYKYQIGGRPVSVFEWRKHQAQRKAQLAQFQQQQNQRLARKGFTQEQLQSLRQQQVIERVQKGKPVMEGNVADEELAFREHLARNTVSPNTQRILIALRRTQNKAKTDNIEQQRRHHERHLVGKSMNLMKAHENLSPVKLDFTGVNNEENILMAPSVFREDAVNNILRTDKLNVMQTREAGNNLQFF